MDATAFCSNHVWKNYADFGLTEKLSMNAPRLLNRRDIWNAVLFEIRVLKRCDYSKISMDATAFCSNHVNNWKSADFGLNELSTKRTLSYL